MMAEECAVLGGSSFRGVQDLIRSKKGVISTRVGCSGGDVPNARHGGRSAQVEAIEIVFDPSIISYRTVLEFFFHIPDPTNVIRQENDRRTSNRPAVIFYTNDTQKQIAWEIITDVEASGLWYGQKVTQVSPAGSFLDTAPEYHHYLDIFRKATPACAGQTHLRCHCY